jgi:hypothetical protein
LKDNVGHSVFLFGAGGIARFNTISCDDGRLLIGRRAEAQPGFPSLLGSNESVLVFHSAQGGDDPLGCGICMRKHRFAATVTPRWADTPHKSFEDHQ